MDVWQKALEEFRQNPLILADEPNTSARATYYYHSCHMLMAYFDNDSRGMLAKYELMVGVFNANESFRRIEEYKYIQNYGSLLKKYSFFQMEDEFRKHMEIFKAYEPTSVSAKQVKTARIVDIQMSAIQGFRWGQKDLSIAEDYFRTNQELIQEGPHEHYLLLLFELARTNFRVGNFEGTVRWVTKWQNHEASNRKNLYRRASQIMYLISHYELGNYDVLPYLIKSTYRSLKKSGNLLKLEEEIMKVLRKLERVADKDSLVELLKPFSDRVFQLKQEKQENNFITFFDLTTWLQSKIEDKTMLYIIETTPPDFDL